MNRARWSERAGWILALAVVLSGATAHAQNVGSSTAHGCTYSEPASWPLDDQLARAEACFYPSALAAVSTRGHMSWASGIRHYATPQTRDALYSASAHATFTVNSAFRTVLEQYWLYIARSNRCGSVLPPGSSNHESGSAVDIQQYAAARSALQSAGCTWANITNDQWHYNCLPAGAPRHTVATFQRLWNLNNPHDRIAEDNQWGPQTQARLAASPRAGFHLDGCTAAPPPPPTPTPTPDAGMPNADAGVGSGDASVGSGDASVGVSDAGFLASDASTVSRDASVFHADAQADAGVGTRPGVVMSSGCSVAYGARSSSLVVALFGLVACLALRRRSSKR